jgi:hypothetical protein
MPVVHKAREVDDSPPGRAGCALCDAPLTFPAVKWVGQLEGQFRRFYIHSECARRIAEQLLAEVDEIGAVLNGVRPRRLTSRRP